MGQIMAIGTYPPHITKDLVALYTKKDKPAYPDFLKKTNNWWAGAVSGNYRAIAIYECPDEKLREALIALGTRYNFYAQVEGYTFEIIPLVTEAEAMKMIRG